MILSYTKLEVTWCTSRKLTSWITSPIYSGPTTLASTHRTFGDQKDRQTVGRTGAHTPRGDTYGHKTPSRNLQNKSIDL